MRLEDIEQGVTIRPGESYYRCCLFHPQRNQVAALFLGLFLSQRALVPKIGCVVQDQGFTGKGEGLAGGVKIPSLPWGKRGKTGAGSEVQVDPGTNPTRNLAAGPLANLTPRRVSSMML